MKIQKILVLTDLSAASVSLLHYGVGLSLHLNAQLWVQHVYYIPPTVAGEVFVPEEVMQNYEQNVYRGFDHLKAEIPALSEQNGSFVASYGDLLTEANRLIDEEGIDLLLVGNRGAGFLTNILGSNTIKSIQQAHCPVLSVPAETVFRPFRRMALALDLKKTSAALIGQAADIAKIFGARVDLVHVSEAPVPVDIQQLTRSLEQALETVPHQFYSVHSLDVESGIARHLEGKNNDLLLLFPRAHSLFDRIFQKSITRKAAYQEKVPLLTLKDRAETGTSAAQPSSS